MDATLVSEHLRRQFDSFHIEMVLPENLQIAKSIFQAQVMVGLEFVPVAYSADGLQIFPEVRIPCPQLPDEPSGNEVINMAAAVPIAELRAADLSLPKIARALGAVVSTIYAAAPPRVKTILSSNS